MFWSTRMEQENVSERENNVKCLLINVNWKKKCRQDEVAKKGSRGKKKSEMVHVICNHGPLNTLL